MSVVLAGRYALTGLPQGAAPTSPVVVRGFDRRLERPVAVKVVAVPGSGTRGGAGAEGAAAEALRREAGLLARIDHPAVVPVYDVGADEGWSFIVFPWVEAVTLGEHLRAGRSAAALLALGAELADAVAALHRVGVVHGDLGLPNVLVTTDASRVRVVGFGSARALDALDEAPGEVRLGARLSPECDVYRLGLMLGASVPHMQPVDTAATARIERWAERCRAASPSDRPAATEVAEALRDGSRAGGAPAEDVADAMARGQRQLVRGDFEEARRVLEATAARMVGLGPDAADARAGIALQLGQVAFHQGRFAAAMSVCRLAIEELSPIEHPACHSQLASWVALVAVSAGDLTRAEDWLGRSGLFLGSGSEPSPCLRLAGALFHRARGNLAMAQGRAETALRHYEASLASCPPDEHPWERSIAIFNLGEAYLRAGRLDDAESMLSRAFALKASLGDRWGMAYAYLALAHVARERGDIARARLGAEAGLLLAEAIGDPKTTSGLLVALARVALDEGDDVAAEAYLTRARVAAEGCYAVPEQLEVRLARAELAWVRGAPEWVEREVRGALRLADRTGAEHERARAE
ncbi:MAG: protein kinase, partial [Myxococcota bacterium]